MILIFSFQFFFLRIFCLRTIIFGLFWFFLRRVIIKFFDSGYDMIFIPFLGPHFGEATVLFILNIVFDLNFGVSRNLMMLIESRLNCMR